MARTRDLDLFLPLKHFLLPLGSQVMTPGFTSASLSCFPRQVRQFPWFLVPSCVFLLYSPSLLPPTLARVLIPPGQGNNCKPVRWSPSRWAGLLLHAGPQRWLSKGCL